MKQDTIVALATAPGRGALSIVRISGPQAILLCDRHFQGHRRLADVAGGRAVTGWMTTGEGKDDLDEVVVTVFRTPKSYTGEDLVEVSCHGGASAGYLLEVLIRSGARPAAPGEFTRRAFQSGRIDLSQAEAVAAVVASRGRAAHRAALRLLKGRLKERLEPDYAAVLSLQARVEAHIEFPDDLEEHDPRVREGYFPDGGRGGPATGFSGSGTPTAGEVMAVRDGLCKTLEHAGRSDLLSGGLRCVFTGPVNVGKSSLFNRILEHERAIVTDEPGTTRDVLEGSVELSGIAVTFVDTAGLREPSSRSEAEGTKRSVRERLGADLVLDVRDASRPMREQPPLESLPPDPGQSHLILLNKVDLGTDPAWKSFAEDRKGCCLLVSARDGTGIEDLKREIERYLRDEPGEEILLNLRQRTALEDAASSLTRAAGALERREMPEIVSFELGDAAREIAGILGRDSSEGLLDTIFSRFCVGK